jgi:hypothetical protein
MAFATTTEAWVTIAAAAVIAGGLIVSTLALVAAIGFLRRIDQPPAGDESRPTLILPLTGSAPQLEQLVAHIEAQTVAPRRLVITVESAEDPAHRRAVDVAARTRLPIEIVIAGAAQSCAQKNFNQLAALARIDDHDDAIIFLDADILPPQWWLAGLLAPLDAGTGEVVTGYRWPIIARPTLGAHLIAAIDRPIAILPRVPEWARMVWGGSVGMSRTVLTKLELGPVLATTLSDDCTIGEQAAARASASLPPAACLFPRPLPAPWSRLGASAGGSIRFSASTGCSCIS